MVQVQNPELEISFSKNGQIGVAFNWVATDQERQCTLPTFFFLIPTEISLQYGFHDPVVLHSYTLANV